MRLVIRNRDTEEIVKSFDVTDKSERQIDRLDNGININLDHENYYTEVVDGE